MTTAGDEIALDLVELVGVNRTKEIINEVNARNPGDCGIPLTSSQIAQILKFFEEEAVREKKSQYHVIDYDHISSSMNLGTIRGIYVDITKSSR